MCAITLMSWTSTPINMLITSIEANSTKIAKKTAKRRCLSDTL